MSLTEKTILKRSVLFLTLFFSAAVFALRTQAAVAVDNSSVNGAFSNTGLATLTVSHTVGGGINRALYVGVSTSTTVLPAGAPANRVASATFEPQKAPGTTLQLERVGTRVSSDAKSAAEIFRLINPPVGDGTVTVNFSTGGTIPAPFVNYAVGGVVSFSGVNQQTPNRTFFSNSSAAADNTPNVIVADGLTGDLVLDTLAISPNGGFALPGGGQTERWTGRAAFGAAFDVGAGSTEPAMSPVVMSWMLSAPDNWALGATAIQPALAATAASVTVGGRVSSANGRGIARARVSITDAGGETRTALTNVFGAYRFRAVAAGETYIFGVSAKRYRFAARLLNINEESAEIDFTAEP